MSEVSQGQTTEAATRADAGRSDILKTFTDISPRPEAIAVGLWEIRDRIAAEIAEARRAADRLSNPPEMEALEAVKARQANATHSKAMLDIFIGAKEGKLAPIARALSLEAGFRMQAASTDPLVQQGAQANDAMLGRIREVLEQTQLLDAGKNTPLSAVSAEAARETLAKLDKEAGAIEEERLEALARLAQAQKQSAPEKARTSVWIGQLVNLSRQVQALAVKNNIQEPGKYPPPAGLKERTEALGMKTAAQQLFDSWEPLAKAWMAQTEGRIQRSGATRHGI